MYTYISCRPFEIQTDHRSLFWLDRLKNSNSRLTRWSLALQPFQSHRSENADALSRAATTTVLPEKGGGM